MSDPSLDDLARRLEQLPREAWERPEPPPPAWPEEPRRERRPRAERLVLRPLSAALASAALVAAGVGGGLLLAGGDDDTTDGPVRAGADGAAPVRLVPVAPRGRGATGTVRLASGPGGQAEVRLTGLRPSARGDFYELWLLGEGGELISLGSFRVPGSGAAELRVPVPVDPARFRYVDVSREPADGDPAHSARSVLRGPTA